MFAKRGDSNQVWISDVTASRRASSSAREGGSSEYGVEVDMLLIAVCLAGPTQPLQRARSMISLAQSVVQVLARGQESIVG